MIWEIKEEIGSIVLVRCGSTANVLLVYKFFPENKGKHQKKLGFRFGYV